MRFTHFSALAASVAAASAFLVPTEISPSEIDIIKSLPFTDAVGIDSRIVELRCPGCPVISDIEGKMHSAQTETEEESMLQLNFSLDHDSEGGDKLLLNGMQIYPLDPHSSTFMEPLTAQQMVKGEDNTWTYAATPKLGYSLSIRHPSSTKEHELDLVSIHIEIVEVADKFLSGLPTIELKVLETPSHKLMIGAAEITPPKSQIGSPTDAGQECTTLVCKWRAIIADRLARMQGLKKGGCGKGKGQGRPASEPVVEVAQPKHHGGYGHHGGHHDRPHAHGSDGAHRAFRHHRHRHGGIARFLRGVVMHIFIPVLIGIMVGITASLVGMVVGHIAIFLWRITFRRGQRGQCGNYSKVEQVEETVDEEVGEDKSFLAHQGPPPEYEVVVVNSEKNEEA